MPLALNHDKKYTYADYRAWPDDVQYELINGTVYSMTPAPSLKHQTISGNLFGQIWNLLSGKPCRVFAAPFDVRFPSGKEKDEKIESVVQPDISIICDTKKLDEKGCRGAPDIIIEIISPSTAAKDLKEKLFLYEQHGVKEYWVVQPDEKIVMVFALNNRKEYGKPRVYSGNEIISTKKIKGLSVDLSLVFTEEEE